MRLVSSKEIEWRLSKALRPRGKPRARIDTFSAK